MTNLELQIHQRGTFMMRLQTQTLLLGKWQHMAPSESLPCIKWNLISPKSIVTGYRLRQSYQPLQNQIIQDSRTVYVVIQSHGKGTCCSFSHHSHPSEPRAIINFAGLWFSVFEWFDQSGPQEKPWTNPQQHLGAFPKNPGTQGRPGLANWSRGA